MYKLTKISVLFFLWTFSVPNLSAQKHSFPILCADYKNGNIMNVISDLGEGAVGNTYDISTVTYVRGIIGGKHSMYLVLEKPNGETNQTTPSSFSLDKKSYTYKDAVRWKNVSFPVKGMYALKVYIDGKLDNTFYFNVGI